tara:strand:+ start:1007 stop:1531 length:525 start_codon:yes stop_codon:yes gene_type:complete
MAKLETKATLEHAIPGSSLTAEPKSRPWRRPYRYSSIDDVAMHYLTIMMDPRFSEGLKEQVDVYPLALITDILVQSSTMEGVHSIDLGALVSPIIIETMKALLDQEGVSYKVGDERDLPTISDVELRKIRDKLAVSDDLEKSNLSEPATEKVTEPEIEEQEKDETLSMGLMSRR